VAAFFRRFRAALEARGLVLRGITTDGSALYPEPIAAAFGDVPHQVCTFHVLRELVKAALSAVAKVRKELTAGKPKLPWGRPTNTDTALAKLAGLRRRLRRFRRLGSVLKKLLSADVEKALTFLDDRLLGPTSNAVERGNRRYRKMQQSVYRVRSESGIIGRIALDLQRESRARDRRETTRTLHRARAA